MNRYYVEGERRAEGVFRLFQRIAPRYDLINDLQSLGLHRRWKRRLIQISKVQPGERALDLCCGTGDLTFALADRGSQVVGVDFSDAMLAEARRRSARRSSRRHAGEIQPCFEEGNALALRFDAASFDLVTVGYGLRNLQSIEAGLMEMARVTRQGGRLAILDFGTPSNPIWRGAYLAYLRTLVPLMGRIFCGERDSYAYILESLRRYPDSTEIRRRMEAAGWSDVRCWTLVGGIMTIHFGWRRDA